MVDFTRPFVKFIFNDLFMYIYMLFIYSVFISLLYLEHFLFLSWFSLLIVFNLKCF